MSVSPEKIPGASKKLLTGLPRTELLRVSVCEVLNIFQANDCGTHVINVLHDILGKAIKMVGMDLGEIFAQHRENVCQRHEDGRLFGPIGGSGYSGGSVRYRWRGLVRVKVLALDKKTTLGRGERHRARSCKRYLLV